MSSARFDEAKGRTKQAVGDLTDNDDLRAEGSLDRASARVKRGAEKLADKVEKGVDAATDRVSSHRR